MPHTLVPGACTPRPEKGVVLQRAAAAPGLRGQFTPAAFYTSGRRSASVHHSPLALKFALSYVVSFLKLGHTSRHGTLKFSGGVYVVRVVAV